MSSRRKQSTLRRASQFLVDALAGRLGLLMMTLSYASLAVVLLAYVSTQVYTSSLMEDVASRQEERRRMEESIAVNMSDYAGLVSRARVSEFCEGKLGMVEGDMTRMTRVRIALDDHVPLRSSDAALDPSGLPEMLGANMVGASEVIRR
ncbi:MAG: hypothetical protein IH969_08250 [Candidatus Krumholzibacteriota bacterium]|nr:hypothetical protein [Candidatus Krumholzibacteriota bacterium]